MAKKLKDEIKSNLTDDVIRDWLTQCLDAWEDFQKAQEEAKSANGVYRNLIKSASKAGLNKSAIAGAIAERRQDASERRMHYQHMGRYLRLMGAPLGTQFSLFEEGGAAPADAQTKANVETAADSLDPEARANVAHAQGFEAGWGGNDRNRNPYGGEDPAREHWARGWDDGQAKAVAELGTKSKTKAA